MILCSDALADVFQLTHLLYPMFEASLLKPGSRTMNEHRNAHVSQRGLPELGSADQAKNLPQDQPEKRGLRKARTHGTAQSSIAMCNDQSTSTERFTTLSPFRRPCRTTPMKSLLWRYLNFVDMPPNENRRQSAKKHAQKWHSISQCQHQPTTELRTALLKSA